MCRRPTRCAAQPRLRSLPASCRRHRGDRSLTSPGLRHTRSGARACRLLPPRQPPRPQPTLRGSGMQALVAESARNAPPAVDGLHAAAFWRPHTHGGGTAHTLQSPLSSKWHLAYSPGTTQRLVLQRHHAPALARLRAGRANGVEDQPDLLRQLLWPVLRRRTDGGRRPRRAPQSGAAPSTPAWL